MGVPIRASKFCGDLTRQNLSDCNNAGDQWLLKVDSTVNGNSGGDITDDHPKIQRQALAGNILARQNFD